ncbi:hypothetical protein MANES_07G070430v8 [Manihot esculenta]|uniref:Uncharacterized protein n=1 Tax=Manihot esculenta TaxID=3983 RepID=A0ACB7HF33_MANES|nr:hypothetical protein MANES_07G070430v8 [Manihot esculenta]
MQCITTVRFSILVNSIPTTRFSPSRGLRQGNPLLLYLFLFVSHALSYLLLAAKAEDRLQDLWISHFSPTITDIMFANYTLLFARALRCEASHLLHILKDYFSASGQCINFSKSHIYFSWMTSSSWKKEILQLFHMQEMRQGDKYLGLLVILGRSK